MATYGIDDHGDEGKAQQRIRHAHSDLETKTRARKGLDVGSELRHRDSPRYTDDREDSESENGLRGSQSREDDLP